jgi:peptidoglycan/LPS O-acetylase OafA/YrhL
MLGMRLFEAQRLAEFAALPPGTQAALGVANLAIFGQDAAYFMPNDVGTRFLLLPQSWSLATELCFYLMAPFLIPRRKLLWAVLVSSIAGRLLAYSFGFDQDPWAYRFFPFEAAFFIAGALSHQVLAPRLAKINWKVTPVVVAGLLLFPWLPVHPVLFAAAFVAAVPLLIRETGPGDRLAGDLSYPVYLTHWPVWLVGMTLGWSPVLVVLATLAAAAVLLRTVVMPVGRLRDRVRGRHAETEPKAFQVPGVPAVTQTHPSVPLAEGVKL